MVSIYDLISENTIYTDMEVKDKEEILFQLSRAMSEENKLETEKYGKKEAHEGYLKALKEREESFSTAVGYSFAIPHGKCKYVKEACLGYVRLLKEIDWENGEKVKHIFMIGVPEEKAGNEHIEILIKLSTAILEDKFRERLNSAVSKKEIMEIIKEYSEKERN